MSVDECRVMLICSTEQTTQTGISTEAAISWRKKKNERSWVLNYPRYCLWTWKLDWDC